MSFTTEVLFIKQSPSGKEELLSCVVIPGLAYSGYSNLSLRGACDYFDHKLLDVGKSPRMSAKYSSHLKLCKNILMNEVKEVASDFDAYNSYSVHFITINVEEKDYDDWDHWSDI